MARSFRQSHSRVVTPRRKNAWTIGPSSNQGLQTISATGIIGFAIAASINEDGLTLVRTRGELVMALSAATGIGDGFIGAVGMTVVTDKAFDVGTTAIPGPVTESRYDGWLYHRFINLLAGAPIAGAAAGDGDQVNATSAAIRLEVDSKAMRKVKADQTIVFMWEGTEVGSADIRAYLNTRLLFKLP